MQVFFFFLLVLGTNCACPWLLGWDAASLPWWGAEHVRGWIVDMYRYEPPYITCTLCDTPVSLRVPPDALRQNQSKILQWISLPHLLPVLQEKIEEFSPEEIDRLKKTQHSVIERTGYLLQSVYKRGQAGVDAFLQCLREETEHPGHQEILNLLEESVAKKPSRSPVMDILDAQIAAIESHVSLTSLLNSLINSGAISVHTYMDVTVTYRTQRENLVRLLKAIREQGIDAFIKFVQCLQRDSSASHRKLSELLLEECMCMKLSCISLCRA